MSCFLTKQLVVDFAQLGDCYLIEPLDISSSIDLAAAAASATGPRINSIPIEYDIEPISEKYKKLLQHLGTNETNTSHHDIAKRDDLASKIAKKAKKKVKKKIHKIVHKVKHRLHHAAHGHRK